MAAVNEGAPAVAPPRSSAKSLVIKGSTWSIAGFGFGQALRMLSNLALQFFLVPRDFGIMGWVNIVINTITMFSNFGLSQSIISSKRGHEQAFLNTAWTILVFRGILMWLTAVLVAWPVGHAVGISPWYIVIAGVTGLIAGLKSTSYQLYQRELAVRTLTLLDLFIQLVTIASSVLLAWLTHSVWAIIIAMLVSNALYSLLGHVLLKGPRNRFHWDSRAAREMMTFGKWMFLSTLLMFAASQIDKILVGSLVPLDMFGVFMLASSLAQLPLMVSSRLGQFVLYPLLARDSRQDPSRLGSKVMRARQLMSGASLLASLCIVFFAPYFFRLFKPEYAAAAWIAQLQAFSVWYMFLQTSCSQALLAVGDSRSLAVSNAIKLPATAVCCLLGYALGAVVSSGDEGLHLLRSMVGGSLQTNGFHSQTVLDAFKTLFQAPEHSTGRMVGFLVGSVAAGYFTQLVVQLALRRHRIRIMRQDTAFTVVLIALSAIGVCVPAALSSHLSPLATDLVAVALATAIVASVAVWLYTRIRTLLF